VSDEALPALEKMNKVSKTMVDMLDDLLDVSVIESGRLDLNLEMIDLENLFADRRETDILLASRKSIKIHQNIQDALPSVHADAYRVEQVLDNLLSNAIKFSIPDTMITISADRVDNTVQISVQDEGQGIPQEELAMVFQEFQRTTIKPTAGESSTGLGLAIVRHIIDAHGGRIWVESEVGRGSNFTFSLPITPAITQAE